MTKEQIELDALYDDIKETQDRYVVKFIVEKYKVSISEAIKLWYSSKTKQRIQTSDRLEVRSTYPTKCFEEFEKELENNPMWFHRPF